MMQHKGYTDGTTGTLSTFILQYRTQNGFPLEHAGETASE
jgi:hypothetical protein